MQKAFVTYGKKGAKGCRNTQARKKVCKAVDIYMSLFLNVGVVWGQMIEIADLS